MLFLVIIPVLIIVLLIVKCCVVGPRKYELEGEHVIVTGGSSGIGKCLAAEVVRRGASVTLFARNEVKLQDAVKEVEASVRNKDRQHVEYCRCDVSGDYDKIQEAVTKATNRLGPVGALINCAGISFAGRFEDVPLEKYKELMQVNYLGSVYVTRAVIMSMKRREAGRIVFVSSQAGQLGVFGYGPYSPSKFALKGLAEVLQMEVKPYNIRVTLSFPPDTDTPGFQEEMSSGLKPEETKLISATSGLFDAEKVSKAVIDDMQAGRFQSYNGFEGWMLCVITAGMSPVTSVREIIEQGFLMSVMRVISLFYLYSFDKIAKSQKNRRISEDAGNNKY